VGRAVPVLAAVGVSVGVFVAVLVGVRVFVFVRVGVCAQAVCIERDMRTMSTQCFTAVYHCTKNPR